MALDPQDEERLKEVVIKFERIIEYKHGMFLNVARRTTAVVRFGMIMLLVVAASIALLLYSLTTQLTEMLSSMETMNQHFAVVENDMLQMQKAMHAMDVRVAYLPSIHGYFQNINRQMDAINRSMEVVDARLGKVTGHVDKMKTHVNYMSNNMATMDNAVNVMGVEMNQMSHPMRMVPAP